jgi:CheY-like chemotaxis protein
VLEVSDTGHGMDEATREKIFEPFFTTKERGKGTGLGLSTVFGIVREFAGTVDVRSQPGRGTTFRLYFPRTEAPAVAPAAGAEPARELARGSGTILVVEDEPLVRAGIRHFLEKLGYDVRVTGDPQEALRLVDELGSELDLLLTDIVMPGMNGPELARRVAAGLPHVQVAFMSAYSDAALVEQGRIESGIPVLEKPFEEDELAARVRDLLAARRS